MHVALGSILSTKKRNLGERLGRWVDDLEFYPPCWPRNHQIIREIKALRGYLIQVL